MQSSSDPTAQPSAPALCWVVTEGAVGMENQALGLAEAIGLPIVVKRVTARAPWKNLPAQIWPHALNVMTPRSDPLLPPWPHLLISCGRRSVPFNTAIRKANAGTCFSVHIQSPKIRLNHFDLVVPPRHDDLAGPKRHILSRRAQPGDAGKAGRRCAAPQTKA